MSKGHSQPRTLPRRSTLGRCRNKGNPDSVVIIDVDKGKVDMVDAPEASHRGSRCFRTMRGKDCPIGVINIDDDDDDGEGDVDDIPSNVHGDAASQTFCHASCNSPTSEELDSDECFMFFRKDNFPPKQQKNKRVYPGSSSRNRFGLGLDSGSSSYGSDGYQYDISESDSSDCEIVEDSSGSVREQWERAAFRKRMLERHQNGSEDRVSASGSSADPAFPSHETSQNNMDGGYSIDEASKHFEEIHVNSSPSTSVNGKENLCSCKGMSDGDPLVASKGNIPVADMRPAASIHHDEPGFQKEGNLMSEQRVQSPDETLFNCSRANAGDQETPKPRPTTMNSSLQHDTHVKGEGVTFSDKEEQFPREPSSRTTKVDAEACFQKKSGPCPVNSSAFDSQTWEGIKDHPAAFQEEEEQVIGKPSCHSNCQQYSDVNHASASFQEKENRAFDKQSLSNSQLHVGNGTVEHTGSEEPHQAQNHLIGEREKHKESDEYKRAMEEEWASRQRQLQIQAGEVQRLRKRRKAESLRLLEMEKRQKQRIEEIRETQKKDEETINLKEKFRTEVRQELDKMEMRYRDMASLLRALGIRVEGGLFPMSHELNAAYKQALLRFHPDRASRANIRQQVEAEEKFKLISRLKDKLLLQA